MDPTLRDLLDELFRSGREHDAGEPEHARRFLNLEPETARLVSLLIALGRRRQILEIGTSNGYSTIWLASAAQRTGGRVVSIDLSLPKLAAADANLRRAGLRDLVELHAGDATEIVTALVGPFDLVFFDADRVTAPRQLDLLRPRLTPDALLLADNALSHPSEIAAYLDAVDRLPGFRHLVVPIGKGLSVAHRPAPAAQLRPG